MSLELLLARANDHEPLLPRGLSLERLQDAPFPKSRAIPEQLWDAGGDPDNLPRQRWGVVAPEGSSGDTLLELVAPLIEWRERIQGDPVVRLRASEKQDLETAARWLSRQFRNEQMDEKNRPRYLLLLGDLNGLSLELQQVLSTNAFVGRLVFSSAEGYRAYCAKVLRWESAEARGSPRPRALLYSARDGSSATDIAYEVLMGPAFEHIRERWPVDLPDVEPQEIIDHRGASTARWLDWVTRAEPGVMLSLSHGLGSGWTSLEQQRALQGALVLSRNELMRASEWRTRTFLPGGIWFCLACYGAGTPGRSSYMPWLQQLRAVDLDAARVLDSGIPQDGAEPFVAALPQAVLANPDGPLAVIGHVDLAWTSTFSDRGNVAFSRFLGVLRTLVEGRRVGNALHSLLRFHAEALIPLTALLMREERALAEGRASPVDPIEKARSWMLCQDLSNYVLLGDPAVRLPGIIAR